eukprot:scaffold1471_cov413-Prasinococcus_capsulatus_cf.AAC.19
MRCIGPPFLGRRQGAVLRAVELCLGWSSHLQPCGSGLAAAGRRVLYCTVQFSTVLYCTGTEPARARSGSKWRAVAAAEGGAAPRLGRPAGGRQRRAGKRPPRD